MKCAPVLAFLLAFSASSWALPAVSPSTDGGPDPSTPSSGQPAQSSQTLSDIAARLSALSMELSNEANDQSIELLESKSLLEESRNALLNSQRSLDLAARNLRRTRVVSGLWRTAALAGAGGLAGASIDRQGLSWAGYGLGIGLLFGTLWGVAEGWLPLHLGIERR